MPRSTLNPLMFLLAAACAALAGCKGESTVRIEINDVTGEVAIIENTGPNTPTGPLTLEERQKLLKAIRKNPERIQTLTLRERQFLASLVEED